MHLGLSQRQYPRPQRAHGPDLRGGLSSFKPHQCFGALVPSLGHHLGFALTPPSGAQMCARQLSCPALLQKPVLPFVLPHESVSHFLSPFVHPASRSRMVPWVCLSTPGSHWPPHELYEGLFWSADLLESTKHNRRLFQARGYKHKDDNPVLCVCMGLAQIFPAWQQTRSSGSSHLGPWWAAPWGTVGMKPSLALTPL